MGGSDANRAIIVGFAALALSMAMVTMRRTSDNRTVASSCQGTVVSEPASFGDDVKRCIPAPRSGDTPSN